MLALLYLTLAALPANAPSADDVLAQVRRAYKQSLHCQAEVHYTPASPFTSKTEIRHLPGVGVKVTETNLGAPETRTLWGSPECPRLYTDKWKYVDSRCAHLDSVAWQVVQQFAFGREPELREGVVRAPRIEPRAWKGRSVHVVTDLGHSGDPAEIWIDPRTFAIVRYVLLRQDGRTIVDFPLVRLGAPLRPADVAFTPPPSMHRFARENQAAVQLVILVPAFIVSTVVWTSAFYRRRLDAGRRKALRRRVGKWCCGLRSRATRSSRS